MTGDTDRPRTGASSRVCEVRELLSTAGVPASYKGPARAYVKELMMPRRRPPARRRGARLDMLLDAAVIHARAAVGAELRAARDKAGMTRQELARRLRRTPRHVGRVERGEASVDLEYRETVLRVCAGKTGSSLTPRPRSGVGVGWANGRERRKP
jgi:ribosome-binding protein aMBF1 (putative translation factor)